MFKKLATALVTFGALAIATPAVFACPHEDKTTEVGTKTAEKTDKDNKKAPVKKATKKPAKKTEKKTGDKVSMK